MSQAIKIFGTQTVWTLDPVEYKDSILKSLGASAETTIYVNSDVKPEIGQEFTVINDTSYTQYVKGDSSGTGISVRAGTKAKVFWDGYDFVTRDDTEVDSLQANYVTQQTDLANKAAAADLISAQTDISNLKTSVGTEEVALQSVGYNNTGLGTFKIAALSSTTGLETTSTIRCVSPYKKVVSGTKIIANVGWKVNVYRYNSTDGVNFTFVSASFATYDWVTTITLDYSGYIRVVIKPDDGLTITDAAIIQANIYTNRIDGNSNFSITSTTMNSLFSALKSEYYLPEKQPDILGGPGSFGNIAWTSANIITNIYEPLRTAYPNYITRSNIGKDASGLYDMWCYIFAPDNYEYTVYLQGGVHGYNEPHGYWGLARIMYMITNESNTNYYLSLLRSKVRFIVVPIVNVWSVTTKLQLPYNYNNVNLNRDWLSATPQQEIVNLKTLLTTYASQIDFGFDLHTDPEGSPGWGGYLLVYPSTVYSFFANRLKRINNYLYYKNLSSIKKAYMGDNLHYPANSSIDVTLTPDYTTVQHTDTCTAGLWTEFGIPSATLEHGDRKFSSQNGTSQEITAAVELYTNHIIQQVVNNFKLERRLYALENP